jgi:hypothetical protein
MKQKIKLQKWFVSTLVGLALGGAAMVARADLITYTVNTYDTAASIDGDWVWWGMCTPVWDGTQDVFGSASSGSLYISAVYGTSLVGGDNQQQVMIPEDFHHTASWDNSVTIDTTVYTNLQLYVKWNNDPTNTMTLSEFNGNAGANYTGGGGGLEVELVDSGWGTHSLGTISIPNAATSGWTVMNFPYNGAAIGVAATAGIAFHVYHPTAAGGLVYAFWIDNVQLQGSATPPPPPKMSIDRVTCKGLQLNSAASAGRYQRQSIRTVNSDFSWVGHTPVTYKWTLTNFSPILATNWFQQFNNGIGSWVNWYGVGNLSWDNTTDGFTNSASGSLKVVAPFTGAAGEQFDYFCTFSDRSGWDWNGITHDGNAYGSLQFDIKVDPSSAPDSTGDFTSMEVGFVTGTGPSEQAIGNYTIPGAATNGWVHVNLNITPNNAYTPSYGIYFKGWVNGALKNTLTFWVDNVVLYPAAEQMHVFLVPQGASYQNLPYGFVDSSVDWNCKTMLFLRIEQEELMANATNFDGGNTAFTARFGYKTNEPSSETMIFNADATTGPAGLLAVLTDTNGLGDWSLTFNDDTDFTLTGPGGVSTNGSIPAGSVSVFNDNMTLYFGSQPNSQANTLQSGQTETLNHIQIIGLADAIDDHFSAPPLNTTVWATDAAAAGSVIWIIPTNAWWIVDWTVPDSGYTLETSPTLLSSAWSQLANVTTIQPSLHKLTVITNGMTPSASSFFRMIKRTPTQIQVLLPGETAAPGTPSGKTGSPTPVGAASNFNVIVNMCDASWNVVNSIDTVQLTSTPATYDAGFLVLNGSELVESAAPLVAGTFTFQCESISGPPGTTCTATDMSNGAITAGVSSTIVY